MLIQERVTEQIIGAAIRVHDQLGPGLLESAYEACLAHELVKRGLAIQRQVAVPLVYDGLHLDSGFRIDLLVEGEVVVELKSIDKILSIHQAQLLTYLRLARKKVGLLINFNVRRLTDGIMRRVL